LSSEKTTSQLSGVRRAKGIEYPAWRRLQRSEISVSLATTEILWLRIPQFVVPP
jgi:hypothetical protein